MADEGAHSLFSASGSDAWGGPCPGKPAMEAGRKTTSAYADEGTAAHELLNWVALDRFSGGSKSARDWLGHKITVARKDEQTGKTAKRVFTVDTEMADHVDDVLDTFMLLANARGAERMAEQRVYYHEHLGVPRHLAFGTTDLGALLWDQPELEWEGRTFPAGDELVVDDLKYGAGVLVTADTMQLRLYAAGLLSEWAHLANVTRVRLVIHQPRKDHYDQVVLSVDELLADIAKLKPNVPKVQQAMKAADAVRASAGTDLDVGNTLNRLGLLGVSDKGCKFCDAKAVCPAAIADAAEGFSGRRAAPEDFENLTVDTTEDVRDYGGNYLASAYEKLDRIEGWMKAVRAEIDRRVLLKGEQIAGCKVVPGKKGKRTWTDAGEAEALAMRAPKPIQELLYDRKLKTPAQIMDKALKTSPLWAAKFGELIHQPEGKPAVVPLTDNRAPMSHKATIHDFERIEPEEQPAVRVGASAGRDRHPFR